MVDSPAGRNQGYYRSGPLNADGTVTAWRPWVAVPDWGFWENQGAGITVADLDGDGTPELVVLAVDNPPGQNGGYYSVGWHLEGGRPADGWGPWQAVPDWCFWAGQGAAAAVANLGQAGNSAPGRSNGRQPAWSEPGLVSSAGGHDRFGPGSRDGRVAAARERLRRQPGACCTAAYRQRLVLRRIGE